MRFRRRVAPRTASATDGENKARNSAFFLSVYPDATPATARGMPRFLKKERQTLTAGEALNADRRSRRGSGNSHHFV